MSWLCPFVGLTLFNDQYCATLCGHYERIDTREEELLWLVQRYCSDRHLMEDAKETNHWRSVPFESLQEAVFRHASFLNRSRLIR